QQFTNESLLLQQQRNGALGAALNCRFQNGIINGLTYGAGGIPGEQNGGIVPDCLAATGLTLSGSDTVLTAAFAQSIRDGNNVFPFTFEKQPFQASLTISLPIFTGFSRQLRLSQAAAQRDDAEEALRARELAVRTDVESRYLGLQTSWRAISVQETSRA
ncbi:MAG: TolC family protein, partial [Gemmatimonadetes bacterium]|nr:TolC family protein [Gemmatimonadota bacterium]